MLAYIQLQWCRAIDTVSCRSCVHQRAVQQLSETVFKFQKVAGNFAEKLASLQH